MSQSNLLISLQFLTFVVQADFYDSRFVIYDFQFLIGALQLVVISLPFQLCDLQRLFVIGQGVLSISELLAGVIQSKS